jgi:hypothetical protein
MKLKSVFVHRKTFKHRRGTTKRATAKRKRKHTKRRRTNKKYLAGGVNTPEKQGDLLTTPQTPDALSQRSTDPYNPGYALMDTPHDVDKNPLEPAHYTLMSSPDTPRGDGGISPLNSPQYKPMPSPNAPDEKKDRKPGQRPSMKIQKDNLSEVKTVLF